MDKDYFIKLTFAVYRVTELFPDDEPLKFEIRKSADRILADLILSSTENSVINLAKKNSFALQVVEEIEGLMRYFFKSEEKKLAKPVNFLILEREYGKVKELFAKKENEKKKKNLYDVSSLSPRKKKILDILKKEKKIQVGEIQKRFRGVSKRTLRRDLESLRSLKLVEQVGKWNEIFYRAVDCDSPVPKV